MEQRFGKKVIQNAVDESLSTDWLSENCKGCPRCGTNIQVGLALLVANICVTQGDHILTCAKSIHILILCLGKGMDTWVKVKVLVHHLYTSKSKKVLGSEMYLSTK